MQFRTIQGDCWLYSHIRSTGRCDIVKTLILLLDLYHWFFVLLIGPEWDAQAHGTFHSGSGAEETSISGRRGEGDHL